MVEVTGGVTNICCWTQAQALRRVGGGPHRFLISALAENSALRSRLQGAEQIGALWTTTSFIYGRPVAPVAEEIWNIGDCAAMVAPLTGDGMGMGLRAAELAATMMRAVFWQESAWDLVTAEYVRRWQRRISAAPALGTSTGGRAPTTTLGLACVCNLAPHAVTYGSDLSRTRQLFPLRHHRGRHRQDDHPGLDLPEEDERLRRI